MRPRHEIASPVLMLPRVCVKQKGRDRRREKRARSRM